MGNGSCKREMVNTAEKLEWTGLLGSDWLDVNFYQAKIMASQYIDLPKLDHAKMFAKNLGTHLVWCQPIISSLAMFQKFLVIYQNFGKTSIAGLTKRAMGILRHQSLLGTCISSLLTGM